MGKVLQLKDGSTYVFTDYSTITNLETVLVSFAAVDAIRNAFTEENLSSVVFDGEEINGLTPIASYANAKARSNIVARFTNGFKTDIEIENLKHQVQQLELENASLSDKAEAADILLGNEEV